MFSCSSLAEGVIAKPRFWTHHVNTWNKYGALRLTVLSIGLVIFSSLGRSRSYSHFERTILPGVRASHVWVGYPHAYGSGGLVRLTISIWYLVSYELLGYYHWYESINSKSWSTGSVKLFNLYCKPFYSNGSFISNKWRSQFSALSFLNDDVYNA